jgi:hypothetical protein
MCNRRFSHRCMHLSVFMAGMIHMRDESMRSLEAAEQPEKLKRVLVKPLIRVKVTARSP